MSVVPTMAKAIQAGEEVESVELRHDGRPTGLCGCCGKRKNAGELVDVRAHMVTALQGYGFMCSGCWSVYIRPGRKLESMGAKPMNKSAFVRGFPGSETTAKAHEMRRRARERSETNINLDRVP